MGHPQTCKTSVFRSLGSSVSSQTLQRCALGWDCCLQRQPLLLRRRSYVTCAAGSGPTCPILLVFETTRLSGPGGRSSGIRRETSPAIGLSSLSTVLSRLPRGVPTTILNSQLPAFTWLWQCLVFILKFLHQPLC